MRHHSRSFRSGFTLMELLIVIMIIAILASLSLSAVFSFIVNAREAATATTISKVNGLLQDRIRSFRQYDFSDAAIRLRDAWNTNNNMDQVMTPELAEVLLRKPRFKQAFPQSFAEADFVRLFPQSLFPNAFGAVPPYYAYDLANFMANLQPGYQARYESGIVLHAMLSRGETFGAPSPADDAFSGAEVRVGPETNNLPCLVDAWGEPLRFYRWPTRLIRCGEQDFDGVGGYDDYNQNLAQEAAGLTSPAIRPYSQLPGPIFPGPTPASLLISNLPPFERNSSYARGPDGQPGVAAVLPSPPGYDGDDDGINSGDDLGEIGWPDSDDPEPLNTDPDDPTFRLTAWFNDGPPYNGNTVPGGIAARRTGFVAQGHDYYTFHTPLIVSSGPDKLLGLYEPSDTANFGHLAAPLPAAASLTYANSTMRYLMDNITNLNQRTGGK